MEQGRQSGGRENALKVSGFRVQGLGHFRGHLFILDIPSLSGSREQAPRIVTGEGGVDYFFEEMRGEEVWQLSTPHLRNL